MKIQPSPATLDPRPAFHSSCLLSSSRSVAPWPGTLFAFSSAPALAPSPRARPTSCRPTRPPSPLPQTDTSPYVEKWIDRCVLIRRAVYPPAAQAPPPAAGAHVDGAEGAPTAASNGGPLGAAPAAAASASEANGGGKAAGVNGKSRPRRAGSGGDAPTAAAAAALVPTRARRLVWRGVVDALLLSLLRGFSRAKRCSTEGRALMSMDLQVIFFLSFRRGSGLVLG